MQNLFKDTFQPTHTLPLLLFFTVLLGFSACENPGSVGNDLIEPGADVVRDTLVIKHVTAVDAASYSGELDFFSAGAFEDPLFGTLSATGFLKPNLPSSTDTLQDDGEVFLKLMYDGGEVFGDSVGNQQFELYEIKQYWRDRALKVNYQLQLGSQKLGEFTVGNSDSLMINLSNIAPQWVDEYRDYAKASKEDTTSQTDSTYAYEENGLALVPQNSTKIIPLNQQLTRFVIQNPGKDSADADTFDVTLNKWGYSLERGGNSAIPQGSLPLHNTYESVINFKELGVSQLDIPPSGLSRAELVFYENKSALEQSLNGKPSTTKRPRQQVVYLQLAEPDGLPENIDPGVPLNNPTKIQGWYSAEEGSYRFDITSLVENIIRSGFPEGLEFFITLPNNGAVKSTILMDSSDQVPYGLKPKIIITSLKNIHN